MASPDDQPVDRAHDHPGDPVGDPVDDSVDDPVGDHAGEHSTGRSAGRPTADVSVRVGWADDARGIAAVQVSVWRREYADVLPGDVLEELDAEQFTTAWLASLNAPQDARNRVLVALERNAIRGFAVTGPAADPDLDPVAVGEVAELSVDPEHTGHGHGSRLVQACADTLRADRFGTAVTWLAAGDDVRRRFLGEAGWAPDGAHRELDLHGDGSVRVKQVRLHTDLSEAPAG